LRLSVVVPTRDRKEKLLTCLEALGRQSILSQEFEVVVVDDGSSDGTKEGIESRTFPFALQYLRQDRAGPGAARNLGLEHAVGELVLFIGDDIVADERLLEEHLLAHAISTDPGTAVLGHIDWPDDMPRNAVMEYVCGDAALQFAYTLIPRLPSLDHRFFYTSNISLRRQFLLDAADAGVRFDPCFRHAAFEDSEFAFRLMPRGLRIRYAENARATHDHRMDLDRFAGREFSAGEMAVIFYRKHPGQDDQLQVRWIADLVEPAAALRAQPELLRHLEAFDVQTDVLLRALAGSLEELLAIERQPGSSESVSFSLDRLRAASDSVLRIIFDIQRTRGKLREWYTTVDDAVPVRAAQT
jgi:glycosyltransferase involved in cell wall biosynthesis